MALSSSFFRHPHLVLARAIEHIDSLEAESKNFWTEQPWERFTEQSTQGSLTLIHHKVRLKAPIPERCLTIAADALNNLRTVLDQAMTSSVVALGGNPKSVYFPFADSEQEMGNAIKGRCKGVPDEIKDLARSFRPFPLGNPVLYAISHISAGNRHRILAPVAAAIQGRYVNGLTIHSGGAYLVMTLPSEAWDAERQELTVLVVDTLTNVTFAITFGFELTFDDECLTAGIPAVGMLRDMARIVESILMAIEAVTERLLAIRQ